MRFPRILRIKTQASIQKQPYSVNNAQIKHIQTVLIAKHSTMRYKSETYKLHFKKQQHLFQKKNKKNPKKFRLKAVWGGLVYHTGGGYMVTGFFCVLSPLQPTLQG